MKTQREKIQILECTIRDGSYSIEYQFTDEDTAIIAAGLERVGFELIEIGHGLGLNATNMGEGKSASTDEEYLKAANSVLKKAKFGMFFIPGIGREEDLKMAAEYGMSFVRIGTNATEIEKSKKYIDLAKKLNMFVCSNLMKSYALSPEKLAAKAYLAQQYGADAVYLVDSAGGMLPNEVKKYVKCIKDKINISVGFHGHNNLGLAAANTIEAIKAGAVLVDSTMQGIGRSAGNTSTELLLLVLKKMGYKINPDPLKVMDLAQKLINPLMRKAGIDPIDATVGYAMFHTKFLKNIYSAAEKHKIDPRELIIGVTKENVVNLPSELLERVSLDIKKAKKNKTKECFVSGLNSFNNDIIKNEGLLKRVAAEMRSFAHKSGKPSILTLTITDKAIKKPVITYVREGHMGIIANSEVADKKQVEKIIGVFDGIVDTVMIDGDAKYGNNASLVELAHKKIKKSKIASYSDQGIWIKAIINFIKNFQNIYGLKIAILGWNSVARSLIHMLCEGGAHVFISDEDKKDMEKIIKAFNVIFGKKNAVKGFKNLNVEQRFDILIGCCSKGKIKEEVIESLKPGGILFDATIGSFSKETIKYAMNKKIPIYRVDVRCAQSGEIIGNMETRKIQEKVTGRKKLAGINVIAGGYIGLYGDIIVDSISKPSKVVGVADGAGGVIPLAESNEFNDRILKIKAEINKMKLL